MGVGLDGPRMAGVLLPANVVQRLSGMGSFSQDIEQFVLDPPVGLCFPSRPWCGFKKAQDASAVSSA